MRARPVRLFLIAALMLSGVAMLPSTPAPVPTTPPHVPADPGGWNSITVDGRGQRHFIVEAMANGAPIDFLIDTGASYVVLSPADAARLGFRPSQLRFTARAATANGTVGLAPVTQRELRIGQLSLFGVAAMVNEAPMSTSLLGMSFLDKLEAWEARGDRLMLYW